MLFPSTSEPGSWRARERSPIPHETLHMLSLVLKTAFRLHCTGERLCGQSPWQLVGQVQQKLMELGQVPESAVSEDWLAWYVETSFSLLPPEPLPSSLQPEGNQDPKPTGSNPWACSSPQAEGNQDPKPTGSNPWACSSLQPDGNQDRPVPLLVEVA